MNNQIVRYAWYWSFEKEEAWLEKMALEGWHLVKASSPRYVFAQGQPEPRVYRIDFRAIKTQEDLDEYVALFSDSGWESVAPGKGEHSYYFYANRKNAAQDIFSDQASRAERYLRVAHTMLGSWAAVFLPYLGLYFTGVLKVGDFSYLTPGLWQMQGADFIWHFLFETPFVLMRAVCGLLPLLMILAGFLFYGLYYRQYKRLLAQS